MVHSDSTSLKLDRPVRVRFAPSPTGYLHVGGARTALYNFLFAKRHGGKFILRIEDTDLERSTEDAMRMQISDLHWLGINWDEGPNPQTLKDEGPYGPYRQSLRKQIYFEYAQKLIDSGKAYYDFRTDAELDAIKEKLVAAGLPPQIEAPSPIVTPDEARKRIAAGEKAAIRYRVTEKRDYKLQDLVRGEVVFPSDMVGDFVCIRSNGMPVYNFCCVIDDALMGITHVFRAEEHLSNTLRQMMLYEAFGFQMPQFGHLSVILGADKQKLSKRHGATSCNEFNQRGYLAEALNNFILLCGWSSPDGREILPREDQIKLFDHTRFNPAPAVFDETKLLWMNATYLRALSGEQLWDAIQPYVKDLKLPMAVQADWRNQAVEAFKTSMQTLADSKNLFELCSDEHFQIKAEADEVKTWAETGKVVKVWCEELRKLTVNRLSETEFSQLQDQVKALTGAKGKTLFQPIRVAVIGQPHGTELKLLVPLLARQQLIDRAENFLKVLGV